MSFALDDAQKRFDQALGLLDAAIARRFDGERSRGDLETELQLMQDDRARLAVELDAAQSRLGRLEAAADHVGERLNRAMGAVREALSDGEAAH